MILNEKRLLRAPSITSVGSIRHHHSMREERAKLVRANNGKEQTVAGRRENIASSPVSRVNSLYQVPGILICDAVSELGREREKRRANIMQGGMDK